MPFREHWRRGSWERFAGEGLAPAALLAALAAGGCASPGPPRAPSLQLPAAVSDLAASRHANDVELTFAVPTRTSDAMPYRGGSIRATVCRAVEAGTCVPVAALSGAAVGTGASSTGGAARATLHDVLPAALTTGAARLLTYRVELTGGNGRTAGYGDAAYAAAGAAPKPVGGLQAEGSRAGVVVRWQPESAAEAGGEVVLRREFVSGAGGGAKPAGKESTHRPMPAGNGNRSGSVTPASSSGSGTPAAAGVVWLSTTPVADPLAPAGQNAATAPASADGVLDDSAALDSTYQYAAERQKTVQFGGHTVVLHSALSAPVEVMLRAVYPPPAPTDLVGTVFPLEAPDPKTGSSLAVDLIWTPADDAQRTEAKIVGYNVVREVLSGGAVRPGSGVLLSATPVLMPAFHDVLPGGIGPVQLRYRVTAVDAHGLESKPVVTVLDVGER